MPKLEKYLYKSRLQKSTTVCLKRSRSIWILCYVLRVLWPHKSTLQSHATPLGFWLLADIDWIIKWFTISQTSSSNICKVMDRQSWWSKNFLDLLGSRLRFCNLYTESLLSGRPRFESQTLQTLRLCSFVALWSIRSYTTSFESPTIPLLGF